MSLKSVHTILEDINSHSGRLEKESIINNRRLDAKFVKVMNYMLNPYLRFNLSKIEFTPDPTQYAGYKNDDAIFSMLDFLATKRGATDQEKNFLQIISSVDYYTANVVDRIVAKDPRCGASIKTFRKFMPEIPYHCPMLCNSDTKAFIKAAGGNFAKTCYSIKKDGVRTWAVYDTVSGTTKYLSRSGKEFPNFNFAFDADIAKMSIELLNKYPEISEVPNFRYLIYDGEVDAGQIKSFQKLMTQIRKLEGVDPQIFKFHVFDLVIDTFDFIRRYQMLYNILTTSTYIKVFLLEHFQIPIWVTTEHDLARVAQTYIDQGEEGIVVKINTAPYEFKRSKYWLKVKKFETIDVEVTGWEYGTGKYTDVIGALNCVFRGKPFNVGSGLSDQERSDFMQDTPTLIEVAYQEVTQDGKPRFGTFVRVRDDKIETD